MMYRVPSGSRYALKEYLKPASKIRSFSLIKLSVFLSLKSLCSSTNCSTGAVGKFPKLNTCICVIFGSLFHAKIAIYLHKKKEISTLCTNLFSLN